MEADISCPVPKQLNYHPTSCQNWDGVSTLVLLYNDELLQRLDYETSIWKKMI